MTTKANLEPEELYDQIYQSNLKKGEKDRLHDWYSIKHTEVTRKALTKLDKVKVWREKKIGKLQSKVLRRLK